MWWQRTGKQLGMLINWGIADQVVVNDCDYTIRKDEGMASEKHGKAYMK